MFRTALTWIVDDLGSDAAKGKGDLKAKVKQMVAEGGIASTIGDWAEPHSSLWKCRGTSRSIR